MPLEVGRLVRSGPGQHAGVAEAGPQQSPQHEHEEHASDHWDDWGQLRRQEGTTGETDRDGRRREQVAEFLSACVIKEPELREEAWTQWHVGRMVGAVGKQRGAEPDVQEVAQFLTWSEKEQVINEKVFFFFYHYLLTDSSRL